MTGVTNCGACLSSVTGFCAEHAPQPGPAATMVIAGYPVRQPVVVNMPDVKFITRAGCEHCGGIGYSHVASPTAGGFKITLRFCSCAVVRT